MVDPRHPDPNRIIVDDPHAGFASGGYVSGSAVSDPDTIPVALSPGGVYVGARDEGQGRRLLDALNAGALPTGHEVVVLQLGQSGGQIAEVFAGSMPCASFTLTNNLSGDRPLRLPQAASGSFDVSGEVAVYFHDDAIFRAMRRLQRGLNRWGLRALRPYLSRRAYRRLRGKAKVARR